jgi:[ribosomal protein S18]-alanine N-acetyltransferase
MSWKLLRTAVEFLVFCCEVFVEVTDAFLAERKKPCQEYKPEPWRNTMSHRVQLKIRWAQESDAKAIHAIECLSFKEPWTYKEVRRAIRNPCVRCMGMVACIDEEIVGYVMYENQKTQLEILNLAVSPKYRRSGIGKALVTKLVSKMSPDTRTAILAPIVEDNLEAHLFFKAIGFKCTGTTPRFFDGVDGYRDSYNFVIRLEEIAYEPS